MSDFLYDHMGKILSATIVLLIAGLLYASNQDHQQRQADMQKAYNVHVRQHGTNVTFDEFEAMMRIQHPRSGSSVTPMPVIIPIR